MDWLEITLEAGNGMLARLCELMESEVEGFTVKDEDDFEQFLSENTDYWDFVDDALTDAMSGKSELTFYLPNNPDSRIKLEDITVKTAELTKGLRIKAVKDEDWENNWKQYYKPIEIGKKLVIIPEWEQADTGSGRLPLRLDPGLIFGTGSHPTTMMCLELAEKYAPFAENVLDLGCGSGILSIASLVLGTKRAAGCDIDPKAPAVALSNARLNGKTAEVYSGDILRDSALKARFSQEKYDLVFANIVADIIIRLADDVKNYMKPDAVFVCSGIIGGRECEVSEKLKSKGFTLLGHFEKDCWHCFEFKQC